MMISWFRKAYNIIMMSYCMMLWSRSSFGERCNFFYFAYSLLYYVPVQSGRERQSVGRG
jgi:hypothetical protein